MESSTTNNPVRDQSNNNQNETPNVSSFECKICMSVANKPVVTHCGHQYCWNCIYTWSEHKKSKTIDCPVCHFIFDIDKVIPLYTTENSSNPTNQSQQEPAPERPRPDHNSSEQQEQRRQYENNRNPFNFNAFGQNFQNLFAGLNGFSFSMNIGTNGFASVSFQPCIFMFCFSIFSGIASFFANMVLGNNQEYFLPNQPNAQQGHNRHSNNNNQGHQNYNSNRRYAQPDQRYTEIHYSNMEFNFDFTVALVFVFIGVSIWLSRNMNRNQPRN